MPRTAASLPHSSPQHTLSRRELNRALLARQMLLERSELSVAAALERLVGLQAQEPQAPYVGLWSRLASFDPEELSGLIAGRGAVRGTLMRCTVHLVTRDDWERLWPVTGPARERGYRASPFAKQLATVELEELLAAGRELLTRQPMSRPELAQLLAARWPGIDPPSLAHAASLLIPVVQVPPRGLWRQGGQARWSASHAWLGSDVEGTAPDISALIRRYLAAYGPATVADVQAWSGLAGLGAQVEQMRGTLRSFRDERGSELFDVPDGLLPGADVPAPARFLAPFDNAQLAHAERARIVDPAHRQAVQGDRLMRTFLIDGFIAGSWQVAADTLELRPFRPLTTKELRELEREGRRLLQFLRPDGSGGGTIRLGSA